MQSGYSFKQEVSRLGLLPLGLFETHAMVREEVYFSKQRISCTNDLSTKPIGI